MAIQSHALRKAQESKARANTVFKSGDFMGALSLYEDILGEISAMKGDDELSQFARTIHSNKAACFMELGRHGEAVIELDKVLSLTATSPDSALAQKTHLRLAKCHHNLQNSKQAMKALTNYKKLHGRRLAEESAEEEKLHLAILQSIQPTGMRAIRYNIKVTGNEADPGMYPVRFYDSVPTHMCTRLAAPHMRTEGEKLLLDLMNKFDTKMTVELVKANKMICWRCCKPALSNVHTPASWLFSDPPFVMDFTQPVCSRGGTCEKEAYAYMTNLMQESQSLAR